MYAFPHSSCTEHVYQLDVYSKGVLYSRIQKRDSSNPLYLEKERDIFRKCSKTGENIIRINVFGPKVFPKYGETRNHLGRATSRETLNHKYKNQNMRKSKSRPFENFP